MGLKEDFEQAKADSEQEALKKSFEEAKASSNQTQLGLVHKYVRPVLEATGMAGGAAIGGRIGGPYGATKGGVLGYAGGNALASLAERLAGEREPIQSLQQAGQETLEGVKEGGLMEAGGLALGKVLSPLLAPFSKQYEGANKAIDIAAKERGIQLDPHEILQSRPIALGHKVLENVPFTSGMIQRQEIKKLGEIVQEWQRIRDKAGVPDRQRIGEIGTKIQDLVESHLDKIGVHQEAARNMMRESLLKDIGSRSTYKELGEQTQQAITQLHEGKKVLEGLAWEHARSAIPESARIVPQQLQQAAQQIKKEYEGFSSLLDEPVIRQLDQLSKSGNPKYDAIKLPEGLPDKIKQKILSSLGKDEQPGWSVQSLLKLRSALGDVAASHHSGLQRGDASKGSADIYGKIYNTLKSAVDKDIESYGKTAGSDIAERLTTARKLSGERLSFFNPKDNPSVIKAIQSDAEILDRILIKPGNAAAYTELKQRIGTEGVKPVKQAFTNRLMGEGGKAEEGLTGLRAKLDQYGKQTLEEIYNPQEIKQLYDLANKSKLMKQLPVGNPFFRELVKSNPTQVSPSILADASTTSKTLRMFPSIKPSLRQSFIDGLHPNADTPFPTTLLKRLNSYPKEVQRQLFSPEELADIHQLARIVERTRGAAKLAENPSGTAQNLVTFTSAGALIKHPLSNAPQALGVSALAKMYLSNIGRKLLLEGAMTPVNTQKAAELGVKIGSILGMNKEQEIKSKSKHITYTPVAFDNEE